jgi:hypothetical protein
MNYALNLIPTSLPTWIELDGTLYQPQALTDAQLASIGWLPLIYDPEGAILGYQDNPCVAEVRDSKQVAVAYALATPAEESAAKAANTRADLEGQIDAQIPVIDATTQVIDPLAATDVIRYASAASDRHIALAKTSDANLATFNPTLVPASPQAANVDYSRLGLSITKQTPWAGQPTGIYGFEAVLQTAKGKEATGSEARLYVVSAPGDTGAVLPFTREGDLWYCRSRDGYKWADPNLPVTVHLLWGAGSTVVSPDLTSAKLYDRQSCAVRYGTGVPAK